VTIGFAQSFNDVQKLKFISSIFKSIKNNFNAHSDGFKFKVNDKFSSHFFRDHFTPSCAKWQ
jgi:hypothetical protein